MLKKLVPIIAVILAMVILFFVYDITRYQVMKVKNINTEEFENKLKEVVNTSSEIDIKEITDFEWDECYVFTPYYPIESIYEKVGLEWTTNKTYIEFLFSHHIENQTVNDDEYVIVFKKGSKVILSEKYSLNKLPIIFKLDNYKFESSCAKFIVSSAKQYNGGKIKELVLKDEF